MHRRQFLAAGAATLAAWSVPPAARAQAPGEPDYRRLLVLVELKGANDSLNTVVPYADPLYTQLRPRLALRRDTVLQLGERTGLHPALAPLLPLWQAGELGVVQGLGYPNPNLSHFRSIEIWDTASASDETLQEGWLASAFGKRPVPARFLADGVVVGANDMGPFASASGATRAIALARPEQFQQGMQQAAPRSAPANPALAHVLKVEGDIAQARAGLGQTPELRTVFPATAFGNAMRTVARLAGNPAGVAAIRVSLNGFDTHRGQANVHQRLLGELAGGLAALKEALLETGRWDTTLIMTYAEFGRRAAENASNGTDHGTAAAHFLLGGRVRGGLHGAPPALDRLEGGNLRFAVDFRQLYATVLQHWWGLPAGLGIAGVHKPLHLLRV